MTRDFDLIRSILFQVHAAPPGVPIMQLSSDSSISEAVFAEHIDLLIKRGLIEGKVLSRNPLMFGIRGLTWEGHDFVEKAQNETIWKGTMAEIKTKALPLTIEIVSGVLTKLTMKAAGLE